jgi:hypothetical protein
MNAAQQCRRGHVTFLIDQEQENTTELPLAIDLISGLPGGRGS